MSRRTRRNLTAEEKRLWHRVADDVIPLNPQRKTVKRVPPAASTVPPPVTNDVRLTPFTIGEAASSGTATDTGRRTDSGADAPLRMDRKAFTRMTRGKLVPGARLDLHGMTLDRAQPALIRFVMQSHALGHRLVLVITGKGRPGSDAGPIPQRPGILRRQAPLWLAAPPLAALVLQIAEAHQRHGGSGAYYVYLRSGRQQRPRP